MRIAFFGTPAFAVPTLEALARSGHDVVVAVMQPDRPRGRGQRVSAGAVKATAADLGLPILQPEKLTREPWELALASYAPDLGVVAAYGKILPDWLLVLPTRGFINVHASLLPRYRGASPVHHAVLNGDARTGVTIMRVVKALDAGAMLADASVPIGADDRTDEIERVLAEVGAGLLVDVVDRMAQGPVPETPQDESGATYAPRLKKEDGLVDWIRPARAIHNQVRALHPWPHAFTFAASGRLILHRSRVEPASRAEPDERDGAPAAAGTVLPHTSLDGVRIATGDGVLEVLELQAEGGKVLPAAAFLTGHVLRPGDRLGSP